MIPFLFLALASTKNDTEAVFQIPHPETSLSTRGEERHALFLSQDPAHATSDILLQGHSFKSDFIYERMWDGKAESAMLMSQRPAGLLT